MDSFNRFIRNIKRSESPFFKGIKRTLRFLFYPSVPRVPRLFYPLLRGLYEFHWLVIATWRALLLLIYWGPLFQARCATFGKNIKIANLPFVTGDFEIHLHDDVSLGGNVSLMGGAICEKPMFVMKRGAQLGWNTIVTVNREVIFEEDVIVSYDCRVSDSDGHRREADLRAANVPPSAKDCLPVRICKDAFVGNGTHVMKGVTIGEGAIVSANSVVMTDIPPFALAAGNPAEVLLMNVGLPSHLRKKRRGDT